VSEALFQAEFAISALKEQLDADSAKATTVPEVTALLEAAGKKAQKLQGEIAKDLEAAVAAVKNADGSAYKFELGDAKKAVEAAMAIGEFEARLNAAKYVSQIEANDLKS